MGIFRRRRSKPLPDPMKLETFISAALTEIINGIASAQETAREKDAEINPPHLGGGDKAGWYTDSESGPQRDTRPMLTPIDFDILVTVGRDRKGGGGFEIGVPAGVTHIGVGITGETSAHSEGANRIKFQVLVKLPQQPRE